MGDKDYIVLVDEDIVRDTQILNTEHENAQEALETGDWDKADFRDFTGPIVLCRLFNQVSREAAMLKASTDYKIDIRFIIAYQLA